MIISSFHTGIDQNRVIIKKYKNLSQLMHHPPRVGENYSSSSNHPYLDLLDAQPILARQDLY